MMEISKGEKKILDDIDNFGWHVLKIMEDNQGPGFCYSIGLYKTFDHPEIVIVGLKPELAHVLINNIGTDIRNGKRFVSGKFYPDILDLFDCLALQVTKENYENYFGYGYWFYKNYDFPVLQCIYPTIEGVYPWETKWPKDLIKTQPILGDIKEIEFKKY